MERMVFTQIFGDDPPADVVARSGHVVAVLGRHTDDPSNDDWSTPGAIRLARIRFDDGFEWEAFAEELSEVQ